MYVLSSLAGAAALVAAARALRLGAFALLPADVGGRELVVPIVIAVSACYAVAVIASYRLPRLMWKRQVPFVWRTRFGPLRASVAYSAVLGAGIFTRINSPAVYLVPIAALLAPSWPLALVPGLLYAFARASIVAVASIAFSERYYRDWDGLMGWISYQRRIWTAVQGIVLASATVAGLAMAISQIGG
ncbi:MAG TPA: hypothetical protein VE596_08485 [Gaiellaceae bacterium]|jgi:hypothetical protein|nr:hypothetical protein [Gaiellaceae bacterium]